MKKVASDIPRVPLLGHSVQVTWAPGRRRSCCPPIIALAVMLPLLLLAGGGCGERGMDSCVGAPQESLDSPIDRRSDFYRREARRKGEPRPPKQQRLLTWPNILTLFRVVFVPVIILLWFLDLTYAPISCAIIFVLQSITDWLDGYLARRVRRRVPHPPAPPALHSCCALSVWL